MTMRRRAVGLVAAVIAVAFVVLSVWLATTAVTYADYPPLTIGDTTVGGPYTLSTVHGNRIGGATAAAVGAVIAGYVAFTRLRRVRAVPSN